MTQPPDPMRKPAGSQPYGGQPAPYGAQPGAPYPPPGTPPQKGGLKQGPGWGVYAITVVALILITCLVVFIVQNTTSYPIKFFGWTGTVSIAAAIGLAALAGLLVGLAVGFVMQLPLRKKLKQAKQASAPPRA